MFHSDKNLSMIGVYKIVLFYSMSYFLSGGRRSLLIKLVEKGVVPTRPMYVNRNQNFRAQGLRMVCGLL